MSIFEMDFTFTTAIATRYDTQADVHVGYCPALGIYSQGCTPDEAENAVVSALTLYMGECYKRGILREVFGAKGYDLMMPRLVTEQPQQYITVSGFDRAVVRSIPLQLQAGRVRDVHCGTGSYQPA